MLLRFVAIGDSLSEGVGDPGSDDALLGWAARLAIRLREDAPDLAFLNVARRGMRIGHVRRRQFEEARRFHPDLVSILVGANDAFMTSRLDLTQFDADLDAMVEAFVADGATVLMATLPDFTRGWPWLGMMSRGLRDRLIAINGVIRRVAQRHETVLLDFWGHPYTRLPGMWSVDGIHPSAYGHTLIANGFATALGLSPLELSRPVGADRLRTSIVELRWLLRSAATMMPLPVLRHRQGRGDTTTR